MLHISLHPGTICHLWQCPDKTQFHHKHDGVTEEDNPSATVFHDVYRLEFHCFVCATQFTVYAKTDIEEPYEFHNDEIFSSDNEEAYVADLIDGGIPWNCIVDGPTRRKCVVIQAPMGMGKTHELAK